MIAIGSLLVLVALSLVVTRIATMVLVATGLSRTVARFQARSALTGAGFTTSESEQVVNHPLRRRVVMLLMLTGNIGLVASAGTLILGFNHGSGVHVGITVGELVGGLLALVYLSRSRWVDRHLTRLIQRVLRRYSRMMRRDVATLVDLADNFAVCEVFVRDGDWVAHRRLDELNLAGEGLEVLGVQQSGTYRSLPDGALLVEVGSALILYGKVQAIDELDARRAGPGGDHQHARRVAKLHRPGHPPTAPGDGKSRS